MGEEHPVLDDPQLTGLLRHKEAAIRRKLHGGRIGQAAHHVDVLEPGRKASGRKPQERRPAAGHKQGKVKDPQQPAEARARTES